MTDDYIKLLELFLQIWKQPNLKTQCILKNALIGLQVGKYVL